MSEPHGEIATNSATPAKPQSPRWWRTSHARMALFGVGFILAMLGVAFIGMLHGLVENWYRAQSQQAYDEGNYQAAIAALDSALEWSPDDLALVYDRGRIRCVAGELTAGLGDINHVIKENPTFGPAYLARANIYERQGKHREAIDDCNTAVREMSAGDPVALNGRAYIRALANLELREGLTDVEQALRDEPDNFMCLDTRGYLKHRLGDNAGAVADLDRALDLMRARLARELEAAKTLEIEPAVIEHLRKEYREHEAVLLHHRGLAHEQLKHADQAKADLKRAVELGYNPEKGVM